jgi:hypothetical protein
MFEGQYTFSGRSVSWPTPVPHLPLLACQCSLSLGSPTPSATTANCPSSCLSVKGTLLTLLISMSWPRSTVNIRLLCSHLSVVLSSTPPLPHRTPYCSTILNILLDFTSFSNANSSNSCSHRLTLNAGFPQLPLLAHRACASLHGLVRVKPLSQKKSLPLSVP